jgi:hypothetical protein
MQGTNRSQAILSSGEAFRSRKDAISGLLIFVVVAVAVGWLIAHFAEWGATTDRIANPGVMGSPRPIPNVGEAAHMANYMQSTQIGCLVTVLLLFLFCIVGWFIRPGHPLILMFAAGFAIIWLDPVMNWAPYAVYDPRLWHWPTDWPWVRVSPSVEPFIVAGYPLFYVGPALPSIFILRRLQRWLPRDSIFSRRPLISLAVITFIFGFAYDAQLETGLVKNQLYIYSQVIPWGSLHPGKYYQFPLIWESSFITFVMIPSAVLLYRDDTGRTQAEKLAQRLRLFATRPVLATFLVMFAILNVAYFAYGGSFAIIRASGLATSVACPWLYPEIKVYDPNGYYEQAGQPGPYFEGEWNTWMSAQPQGRPAVTPPPAGVGACAAKT